MANIHGFNNAPDDRNDGRRRDVGNLYGANNDDGNLAQYENAIAEHFRIAEHHKVLFVSGKIYLKDPRDEHYWDMLKFALCPTFSFLSITFLIIIACLVMFVVSAAKGIQKQSEFLLQIQSQVMLDLGANQSLLVLDGEVHRLIAAIFLHWNFMHIVSNMFAAFIFLTRIQYTFGWWKTLIIFILSGIMGNIFSDLLNQSGPTSIIIKAGASTALYGIMGVIIGYIVVNWYGIDLIGPVLKCQLFCVVMFVVLFILIFTPTSSGGVDYFGHLGGFLSGICLASIHNSILDNKFQRIVRIVFICLFVLQVLLYFLIFYLQ